MRVLALPKYVKSGQGQNPAQLKPPAHLKALGMNHLVTWCMQFDLSSSTLPIYWAKKPCQLLPSKKFSYPNEYIATAHSITSKNLPIFNR